MIAHTDISDLELRRKIKSRTVLFAGNKKLKIYGRLDCQSGKRMKRENRVFLLSGMEAEQSGYRPCGRCLKQEYRKWK